MIKVDIVNEVSKLADITKVKAEVAVDAVFDAMRMRSDGERMLRGFGVFQKPRKRGIEHRQGFGSHRAVRFKPGRISRTSLVRRKSPDQ